MTGAIPGSKEEARAQVERLVERFRENIKSYKNGSYNETQTRREFIDPFFKSLGWDVDNEAGYAEAYKDVIHEDAIKVGGVTKAPDYCFRIGGQRKFFVEAKKPAVDMKNDPEPYYQLRRYAFSAKLPLSILTDFEELAVVDCRAKPSPGDKASTGRIRYWRYDEYLDHLDELIDTFSPEGIKKGGLDKLATSARAKRGTGEVDKEFLKEIETWRELLARNIALRNPGLSQHELNTAVQLTIDRIIFLRICEDRGIEEYGRLQGMQNGANVYKRLCELFRRADERYNSGLFHFKEERGNPSHPDELTLALAIDDKPLKELLKGLYYPDSPYEFSVLPADILGQVYEQFLGKVIRLTAGHRAVVEDKPEVKKAGGVYYTPTYIVDYIVRNTVGKLLGCEADAEVCHSERSEESALPEPVKKSRTARKPRPMTPKEAAKLRILDPACGSGSFLIGAFEYLMDWHRDWYAENDPEKWAKGKDPRLFRGKNGWQLTTAEKKRILLNNIYGVDIDTQAVEVTRLSLLLKVLEEENAETIGKNLSLFHERALPDLSNNIKCGNSLIGSDFYEGQQLGMLDEEERLRINAFDWVTEFPESFSGKNPGFDAVIGNPPYGATLEKSESEYLAGIFQLQNYQLDTYYLFIEKGISLIRAGAFFGMIFPNTWLLNLMSPQIRQHIINWASIKKVVHYLRPVFSNATVDTEIVVIEKQKPRNNIVEIEIVEKDSSVTSYTIAQKRWQLGGGNPINIFERPEFIGISDKLKRQPALDKVCLTTQGTKPFQVGKGRPPQTRKIVDEKPFVSEIKKDKTFRPLLRGSLIQRYKNLWANNYWISYGDWLAEPRYSASYDAEQKIVIRQTGDSPLATLDDEQFVVRDNLYTIIARDESIDLHYMLGILNSSLMKWFYQKILNPEKGEALAQVKRGHIAQLPIAQIDCNLATDKSRHDQMVELVERMLDLNKQLQAAKTSHEKNALQRQIDATDRQIDQLVYELYDLNVEEIKIVESISEVQA